MPKKRKHPADRRAEWPELPAVSHKLAHDIEIYLKERFETKKPPAVTARTLGLIIELCARSMPFPTRDQVAYELNCSKFGIDSALSVALSRGLITTILETEDSKRLKDHVIRLKYYIPDTDLLEAVGRQLHGRRVA